jgi:hypothetical protein
MTVSSSSQTLEPDARAWPAHQCFHYIAMNWIPELSNSSRRRAIQRCTFGLISGASKHYRVTQGPSEASPGGLGGFPPGKKGKWGPDKTESRNAARLPSS